MRVVIHIGTHKTGTSSIQGVMAKNRDLLAGKGIWYPQCRYSARNLNFLGWRLATKQYQEPSRFLEKAVAEARDRDCHTLLLSGESFYAMTGLFHNLLDRPVDDYWDNEEEAVRALAGMLPDIEVKVVCYVRRQDLFLESLYNQFVKQAPGYFEDLNSFIEKSGPIADYAGHLDIWAKVFGDDAMVVRPFDDLSVSLMDDFSSAALGLEDTSSLSMPEHYINERLPADLLQFKRIVNRLRLPLVEGYAAFNVIVRLAQHDNFASSSASLISAAERKDLLSRYVDSNARLAEYMHGRTASRLFSKPVDTDGAPDVYRLSMERALEIYLLYRQEMNRPRTRMKIFFHTLMRGVMDRVPWLEYVLGGARRIVNAWRFRREWQGIS